MGIESGGRSYSEPSRPEKPQLSRQDLLIRASILNPEDSKTLFEANPVAWIRGAIGVDTERGASEISDRELFLRYIEGGKVEWDRTVVKSVRRYLKGRGFF